MWARRRSEHVFAHIKEVYPRSEHVEACTIGKARLVLQAIYQLHAFVNQWETEDDVDATVQREYIAQRDALRTAVRSVRGIRRFGNVMRDTLATQFC